MSEQNNQPTSEKIPITSGDDEEISNGETKLENISSISLKDDNNIAADTIFGKNTEDKATESDGEIDEDKPTSKTTTETQTTRSSQEPNVPIFPSFVEKQVSDVSQASQQSQPQFPQQSQISQAPQFPQQFQQPPQFQQQPPQFSQQPQQFSQQFSQQFPQQPQQFSQQFPQQPFPPMSSISKAAPGTRQNDFSTLTQFPQSSQPQFQQSQSNLPQFQQQSQPIQQQAQAQSNIRDGTLAHPYNLKDLSEHIMLPGNLKTRVITGEKGDVKTFTLANSRFLSCENGENKTTSVGFYACRISFRNPILAQISKSTSKSIDMYAEIKDESFTPEVWKKMQEKQNNEDGYARKVSSGVKISSISHGIYESNSAGSNGKKIISFRFFQKELENATRIHKAVGNGMVAVSYSDPLLLTFTGEAILYFRPASYSGSADKLRETYTLQFMLLEKYVPLSLGGISSVVQTDDEKKTKYEAFASLGADTKLILDKMIGGITATQVFQLIKAAELMSKNHELTMEKVISKLTDEASKKPSQVVQTPNPLQQSSQQFQPQVMQQPFQTQMQPQVMQQPLQQFTPTYGQIPQFSQQGQAPQFSQQGQAPSYY